MLTKEQEQKIKEAASFGFNNAVPRDVVNSTFDAIVTAIKAYDNLKDVEEVKAAVKAAEASGNDDDCYVVFRPISLEFKDSMKEIRVFNSEDEMLKKLNEENKIFIIAIDDEEFNDDKTGWLHSHYVSSVCKSKVRHYTIKTLGICDCKTFKKG